MISYVVICRADRISPRRKGPYVLATRRVFNTQAEAQAYTNTVNASREALVIEGRWHQLRIDPPADPPIHYPGASIPIPSAAYKAAHPEEYGPADPPAQPSTPADLADLIARLLDALDYPPDDKDRRILREDAGETLDTLRNPSI